MAETYESIRDGSGIIPKDVQEKWQKADHHEKQLRYQYSQLIEDSDLTDEARARRAGELYEKHRGGIETKKTEAREGLVQASKSLAKSSIPRPEGEGLSSKDASKLLLDQNEANRIIRTVERRKGQGPFKQDTSGLLAQEYARGLEVGGVEGGAVCRGVLRAASELGIGTDWIDSLRSDQQKKMLDDSRRLEYFSQLISTKVPTPPTSIERMARRSRQQFAQSPPPVMVLPTSSGASASLGQRASKASRKAKDKA